MKITTERLTLIPIDVSFIDSTCEYALEPDNARLMVFYPKKNREEIMDYLKIASREWQSDVPEFLEYAVLFDGKHIGSITMYFEGDFTRGELGWILHRDYWGNGYAAEAAKGLMEYFRDEMGLHRFIAHCDSENTASQRVMAKLGMRFVETHGGRFNRLTDGERQEHMYEIII